MNMTKGQTPTSKSGGMKAHLGGNGCKPRASRSVDTSFGGKAAKHLKQEGGKQKNKFKASNSVK